MRAILLSIGDELALGQTVDTNAPWLANQLAQLGIRTAEHRTVHDDLDAIADTIREAAGRCELLIITGGLGPTADDLTRPALAQAMGVELVEDPASIQQIQAFFQARGREMPERNRVQAAHPRTSVMIPNPRGTAPGIDATLGPCRVFVAPGVPHEMAGMYEDTIEPALRAAGGSGRVILSAQVNTFGSGESDIAQRLGPLMARGRNPVIGITAADGIVSVRIRAESDDAQTAAEQRDAATAQVEQIVGPLAFGRDTDSLQAALVRLLGEQGLTVATAESCTGGMIASMLTDVPGASGVVRGGWVTYANAMKTGQLGVPHAALQDHGAVSGPVVRAMARGALERAGADLAVSTSGVAGPGGGTQAKPVGTVWVGLAWRAGGTITTDARRCHFFGDRAAVRDRSAKCALQLLRLHLLGEDLGLVRWAKPAPTTP